MYVYRDIYIYTPFLLMKKNKFNFNFCKDVLLKRNKYLIQHI